MTDFRILRIHKNHLWGHAGYEYAIGMFIVQYQEDGCNKVKSFVADFAESEDPHIDIELVARRSVLRKMNRWLKSKGQETLKENQIW